LTRARLTKVLMQTIEDYLHDLKAQERELLLRLSAVQSAIDAITRGQLTTALPIPALQPQAPRPPSLDSMRTRDAIKVYLGWRADQGMAPATLGELEQELSRHRVVSFRNQPLSEMGFPWKGLCNSLGAADNQKIWKIDRLDPDGHFTRNDKIELLPKERAQRK
jgi:hypothetical protein